MILIRLIASSCIACIMCAAVVLALVALPDPGGAPRATAAPLAKDPPPAAPKPVPEPPDPEPKVGSQVYQVAYSRDGRYLALTHGKTQVLGMGNAQELGNDTVTLIDTTTYKEVHSLTGPTAVARGLAFTTDGKTLFAACDDGTVYTWDVATGKAGPKLEAGAGRAASLDISPDGKQLATVHVQDPWLNKDLPESWVQLWDLKTLKPTRKLKGDGKLRGDTGVRFSPDGGSVAAIFAPTFDERKVFTGVVEWDAASGKELRRYSAEPEAAGAVNGTSLAFTPDGKWLVVGGSEVIPDPKEGWLKSLTVGHIWVFDHKTGKLHKLLLETAPDHFMAATVSADGKRLYAASRTPPRMGKLKDGTPFRGVFSTVQCWDTDTWKLTWTAEGQRGAPWAMGVSPNGKRVTVSDEVGVWLFDATKGEPRGGLVKYFGE